MSVLRRPRFNAALAIAVTVVVVLGATDSSAQRLVPHIPFWDRYFDVTYTVVDRGTPYVAGHLSSKYGATATRVQMLVESLDDSGAPIAQRVRWLGRDVTPFTRVYFEEPVPQRASRYRVQVFAFDFQQAVFVMGSEAP